MLIYNIVSLLHSVLDNHYATGKIMTGWHNHILYGIPTSFNDWKKWNSGKCLVRFSIC